MTKLCLQVSSALYSYQVTNSGDGIQLVSTETLNEGDKQIFTVDVSGSDKDSVGVGKIYRGPAAIAETQVCPWQEHFIE